MPVQDIRTLYKFRSQIEPALVAVLTDQQLPGLEPNRVFASHSTETISTPYVLVQLRVGAALGHMYAPPTLAYYVPDMWQAVVLLELRTARGVNAAMHEEFEATCRMGFSEIFSRVNTRLDFHAFADQFRDIGSTYAVDAENKHDVTQITFGSVLAIRSTAWPTS